MLITEHPQSGRHDRQLNHFGKNRITKWGLIEQIADHRIDQRGQSQGWIAFNFRIEDDGSILRVVLPQQTAGPFAGAAPSSSAAATCRLPGNHTDLNIRRVVT